MRNGLITCVAITIGALVLFYAPDAFAAGDVVGKGEGLVEFLSEKIGPIIIGLGIIGGGGAMALGVPGAPQKIAAVLVGGVLITSVSSIISVVQSL